MSTFAIADPSFHPLMLSSRLISELAQARSTLRATTERCDLAVIVSAGGELDASNDAVWRRLLSEAAAAAGHSRTARGGHQRPGLHGVLRILRARRRGRALSGSRSRDATGE